MKKKDCIHIRGLRIFAHHGVFAFEKKEGQMFVVNADLYTDLSRAGASDRLEESTHYGEVCEQMKKSLTRQSYDLIERAAEEAARDILLHFPLVEEVTLELQKPQAPVEMEFETLSVEITRGWHKIYIAFGSNMGNSRRYIKEALISIEEHPHFRGVRTSEYFITAPYGEVEQEDFINGVLEAETLLNPRQLLDYLHQLEAAAGRERKIHWGPRTLDLDILFYDKEVLEEEDLQIPHRDMANRDFVLIPLMQLAPCFRHPVLGKTVEEMAGELKERYVRE
ncbi:MAG: 2-amino-4-hydroxy-6-hydroxymethyldihydropteridine diphosphokinase [Lachnospiraceae bacterium]|nr:2-amino-4-hydroxy-6-hydroxymethyldihydropteridine diphosphokinase [Lachnospiraceae bacterium]